jgi:hypothetical protein
MDCLANLDKVLTRCAEVDLVLNWEKCHFMVKQGTVLGHVISERGIEVDKAKVETVEQLLLTPKIGTGKGLTCGPSLVTKNHSTGKISSEDSVKVLAVGNTPSFGKRTVCVFKRKFSGMRDDVARIKGRDELMTGTR